MRMRLRMRVRGEGEGKGEGEGEGEMYPRGDRKMFSARTNPLRQSC